VVVRNAAGGVLSLTPPPGAPPVEVPLTPGNRATLQGADGQTIASAMVLSAGEMATRCVIAMAPTQNRDDPARQTPSGDVKIALTAPSGSAEASYYADVQRDDTPATFPRRGLQSYLETKGSYEVDPATLVRDASLASDPISRASTLSPYATTLDDTVIVVGGAIAHNDRTKAALYTSAGPTPGRAAPTCAAISDEAWTYPGQMATGTFSGSTARLAGSSVAAPLVARALVDAIADGQIDKTTTPSQALAALGWPANDPKDEPQLGLATLPLARAPGRKKRRV